MNLSTGEQPVFFPAGDNTLFGIHSHPTAEPRGVGVILIAGGDAVNAAFGRNHNGVHMARRLAADGYDVLQFTYHGVGDSTGIVETLHLERPFTDDVVGAAAYLRGQHIRRLVLIGSCFGSRTALSSAPLIPETVGLVLATPPSAGYDRMEAQTEFMARNLTLGEYARKALHWEKVKDLFHPGKRQMYLNLARGKFRQLLGRGKARASGDKSGGQFDWVSPMFIEPLETMVDNGVPVLFSFGTHDQWLEEFKEASRGPLGPILARGDGSIDVIDDLPGVAHGLVRLHVQEAFADTTIAWIKERIG